MDNQECRELGGMPVGITDRDPLRSTAVWCGIVRLGMRVRGGREVLQEWKGIAAYALHPEKMALERVSSPWADWKSVSSHCEARVLLRITNLNGNDTYEATPLDCYGWDEAGNDWVVYTGFPLYREMMGEVERIAHEIALAAREVEAPAIDMEF